LVGVLGGTFNPPHNGHVALAREAIARFGLRRLVVMVAGTPPHKSTDLDAEGRFRLAQAAFADMPGVVLSRFELERNGPSYTVDTVRFAEQQWGDVIFLVGADEFADFLSWREPDEVLERARLGVATRPGYPRERLDDVLAKLARPDRVELFQIEPLPISSSGIRERVAHGEPIGDLVPPRVAEVIDEMGLYRV
jgi:nicotinate-nucleotide adenylyltransferase